MGRGSESLDERDIVFEHVCRERNGEVVRSVKPMQLGLDKLRFLWNKLGEFDVLFNDYVKGDFSAFINHFVTQDEKGLRASGLMWEIDDVGMFLITDIKPAISASAHFVFWDRVFRGRESLCREGLRQLFRKYLFQRIQVEVPLYAKKTLYAVERIGFIHEGRLRRSVQYKGEWFDVNIYSMIPEDLDVSFDESTISAWKNRRKVCWGCAKVFTEKNGADSFFSMRRINEMEESYGRT
jgi:RimJ/RimL family protein N-acetyltransferase